MRRDADALDRARLAVGRQGRDLHVVVGDGDGAAIALQRVDDLAHAGRPREVHLRHARREREHRAEAVLGVRRAAGVPRARRHRRGQRREPLEREVEAVAAVVHRDAAACQAPLAPPVGAPLGDAARVRGAVGAQRHAADGADAPRGDDLANRLDHRGVLVVVAGEEDAAGLLGAAHQLARGLDRRRQRLLAEHVQPRVEGGERDGGVVAGGRRDVDEVEPLALGPQERLEVAVQPHARDRVAGAGAPGLADVGHGDDLDVAARARALEVGRNMPITRNEPVTHDGAAEGARTQSLLSSHEASEGRMAAARLVARRSAGSTTTAVVRHAISPRIATTPNEKRAWFWANKSEP